MKPVAETPNMGGNVDRPFCRAIGDLQEAHSEIKDLLLDASISDASAAKVAAFMVDRLIARVTDEDTIDQITKAWGAKLDRQIGKTIRRGFYVLLTAVVIAVAANFNGILNWIKR